VLFPLRNRQGTKDAAIWVLALRLLTGNITIRTVMMCHLQ